ncbi:MAG: filamentous hemagglutinin N-terminal domain-containing protein, partial [Methylococcaceae bacterium]|nr:filamentous hemagglutinin N-terminal domain-containing protein [Methylococcaceae bacterium]
MNQQHNAVLNFKLRPLSLAIRVLMTSGLAIANTYAKDPVLPEALNSSALATSGAAAYTQSGHLGTIKQTTDKAILEWKSFNIGSGDKVVFDQPNATSVALNNIHQSDPSQIMGSLKANGQIYLVNQNGFVFGKDSQVNVNSFVASTLGISRDVFERGLTKVFNIDNSAALQGNGEVYLKNDQGDFLLDQTGQKIKIQIMLESGADIKT